MVRNRYVMCSFPALSIFVSSLFGFAKEKS